MSSGGGPHDGAFPNPDPPEHVPADELIVTLPVGPGPWGSFHGYIAERLGAVTQVLRACQDAFFGGADALTFGVAARSLRDSTLALARACRDVDRWQHHCRAECDAVAIENDGVRWWPASCALPGGHEGDHDADPAATFGEFVGDAADVLAYSLLTTADVLRWATGVLDHHRDPQALEVVRRAAYGLVTVRDGLDRVLPRIAELLERYERGDS